MRCDQYMGLSRRAHIWILENAKKVAWHSITSWEDGRVTSTHGEDLVSEPCGKIQGAWTDNVAELTRYTMKDGTIVEEFIQAEPWSSGPMYFIGLRGKNVPKTLNWSDREIEMEGEE